MDKKSNLLSHLKRQVVALKHQLEVFQKGRTSYTSKMTTTPLKASAHSPRFDSHSIDASYLDKGIRKYPANSSRCRNIAELIKERSQPDRIPKYNSQRRKQEMKTRQNFSIEAIQQSAKRSKSPNPLTGQGYSSKPQGIRTVFGGQSLNNWESGRKSFCIFTG